MTQYSRLNVKLSNSQLNKSAIQSETEVVLRLSWNMIGDNETNFPHKLLLTNRQVSNLCKASANYLSADIKLSKTQLSKMIQSGGFLGRLPGPLLKTGLPLIKNAIKPLIISNNEMEDIIKIDYWNTSKWNKRTKRRISEHVIRYIRWKFIRKYSS